MAVTVEALRGYVGASVSDDSFLETCLDQAVELVDTYVGTTEVPQVILDNAYTQVGSELYHRRSAPSGITQFASFDGSAIRVARDPLTSVYAVLNRYVVSGV